MLLSLYTGGNGMAFIPVYLRLLQSGELSERVSDAYRHLDRCDLCAWECRVDRNGDHKGVCHTGKKARLASYNAHLGEEAIISGRRGSGTIFFAGCNMRCQFCQNHAISQTTDGNLVDPEELAAVMLELQAEGCHNINLVSPSHVIPQILAALLIAAQAGLHLPLVYNTGGYDSLAGLKLLEDVIDIYMPDMKYSSQQIARVYSKTPHYPEINRAAVKEMHRQVGDLRIDQDGLAKRGLLVRHLVLPNGLGGTADIVLFLKNEISADTYLNLMDQYRPAYNVKVYPHRFPKLARPIKLQEYQTILQLALDVGITRLDPRST
jgi:putative pyruvate formate lyase activating enzyme